MSLFNSLLSWDARALTDRRVMVAESLLLFALFGLLHWLVFGNAPYWTDTDAPYHHLLQAEIHRNGWWRDITWLPHTVLGTAGPDHHWLWHLLLSPFSAIDDLTLRVNVVNAFSFALVPAFTNLAFRLLGIRFAPLWVLLVMAGTSWTLFRWSMARAQNPACVLMILFVVALARHHRLWLMLLPLIFMKTYHGAALLAVPGIAWFGLQWWREKKADWWLLLLPAVGGALALVASPWYPHNIEYFLFHTLDKVGNELQLDVGREWYGVSPLELAGGLAPQLAALGVALLGAGALLRRHLSTAALAMLVTAAVFMFFTTRHLRFIEYCPQVVVLAAALVVRDCSANFTGKIRPAVVAAVVAAALMVLVAGLALASQARPTSAANSFHYNENVGRLLTRFAEPGALVANARWDLFPTLVWHAPGLRFLAGLDPYYLAYGDPDRFIALEKLRGNFIQRDNPDVNVRADLGSDWVVTDSRRIVGYLAASGQASIVMFDGATYVIYVGTDPSMPDRLATEGRQWLQVYWRRPPARESRQ